MVRSQKAVISALSAQPTRCLRHAGPLLAKEHKFVIAKEAYRLRQSTKIFHMDGHVAALLAMTMLGKFIGPIIEQFGIRFEFSQ